MKGGKPKRAVTRDKGIWGLGVRVCGGERLSYVIRYGNAQRPERLLIPGSASILTLDQAQKKAKKLLGQVPPETGRQPFP